MEAVNKKQDKAVILPKGRFATHEDGDTECCEYCEHNIDEKDGYLFFSDKVKCEIDGKWHNRGYVCRNYK